MKMNEQAPREKKAAKILFWGIVVPTLFSVFIRLFYLMFSFFYGTLLALVLGEDYSNLLIALSLLTALLFTIGTLAWVYRQYKTHILGSF